MVTNLDLSQYEASNGPLIIHADVLNPLSRLSFSSVLKLSNSPSVSLLLSFPF